MGYRKLWLTFAIVVVAEGAVVRRGARVIRSVLLGAVEAAPGESVIDEFRAAPGA